MKFTDTKIVSHSLSQGQYAQYKFGSLTLYPSEFYLIYNISGKVPEEEYLAEGQELDKLVEEDLLSLCAGDGKIHVWCREGWVFNQDPTSTENTVAFISLSALYVTLDGVYDINVNNGILELQDQ